MLPENPQDSDARTLTRWCDGAIESLGLRSFAPPIQVSWNSRLRTSAGRAFIANNLIELNPALIRISHDEVCLTLKHELAHLIAYRLSSPKKILPHGQEWKTACAALGIPRETARHTLPFPARRYARNHHYQCRSCGIVIDRVRPFRRAVACSICCNQYNQGNFSSQFAFKKIKAP